MGNCCTKTFTTKPTIINADSDSNAIIAACIHAGTGECLKTLSIRTQTPQNSLIIYETIKDYLFRSNQDDYLVETCFQEILEIQILPLSPPGDTNIKPIRIIIAKENGEDLVPGKIYMLQCHKNKAMKKQLKSKHIPISKKKALEIELI